MRIEKPASVAEAERKLIMSWAKAELAKSQEAFSEYITCFEVVYGKEALKELLESYIK